MRRADAALFLISCSKAIAASGRRTPKVHEIMTTLLHDLRYGAQMLVKHPAFTIVAVLTLALGVGANTALFSVVDAVLLKKLPVKDPDRLVLFKATWDPDKFGPGGFNGTNVIDPETRLMVGTSFPQQTLVRLRQEQSVLSDVFAFGFVSLNLNVGGQAEVVNGQAVSGNYYSALGVPAILGRTISEADDNAGATPVVVLSHRLWTNRFGADRSVVGRQVNINNVAFTIAGVTPAEFSGTSEVGSSQDVSIPLAWEPQIAGERTNSRGAGKGATLLDTSNGKAYINTGTEVEPAWTIIGTQS